MIASISASFWPFSLIFTMLWESLFDLCLFLVCCHFLDESYSSSTFLLGLFLSLFLPFFPGQSPFISSNQYFMEFSFTAWFSSDSIFSPFYSVSPSFDSSYISFSFLREPRSLNLRGSHTSYWRNLFFLPSSSSSSLMPRIALVSISLRFLLMLSSNLSLEDLSFFCSMGHCLSWPLRP